MATFHTRAWKATRTVADLEKIDLGGRVLEVLRVPGHTPDSVALFDRAQGLLWTGDSFYEGTIWLFVPETDLEAYEASMARLAALLPGVKKLLPAHNTASAEPRRIGQVLEAIRQVRAGNPEGPGGIGRPAGLRVRRLLDPHLATPARPEEGGDPRQRRVGPHRPALNAARRRPSL